MVSLGNRSYYKEWRMSSAESWNRQTKVCEDKIKIVYKHWVANILSDIVGNPLNKHTGDEPPS